MQAQAVTLYQLGFTNPQISRCLSIGDGTIRYWVRFAKKKGWEGVDAPEGDRRRILTVHVEADRSPGRPKEVTEEDEANILSTVRKDHLGKEKSSKSLAMKRTGPLQLFYVY